MPKSAITRVSNLAITPSSTNNNNGLYVPQLTTTQRGAIPASTLTNGALIYNTTDSLFQGYVGNAWVNLDTGAAATFIAPNSATDPGAPANGQIYYNTTANVYKAYLDGAWTALVSTTDVLLGNVVVKQYANAAGLPAGSPGMIVYQTDITAFKMYNGATWNILFSSSSAATGVALTNGTPVTLPSGPAASVEVAGNEIDGFAYNNSTGTATQPAGLRSFLKAVWQSVYSNPSTVSGVGLTATHTPFMLPQGTSAAVEVAANEVPGFMYYNTTANTVKVRTDAAWVTVTTA